MLKVDLSTSSDFFNIYETGIAKSDPLTLTIFLLKYYIFMNNYHSSNRICKMILFSNNDAIIDKIHELSIILAKGIYEYNLISMSKYSFERGTIRHYSLKNATTIVANIHNFTSYLNKSKTHGNYENLENIIAPWHFDLIIMDNAWEIILNNTIISNLLKTWDPVECHALVICKSNDTNHKTKQEFKIFEKCVELNWMEYFYPRRVSINIENIY